MIDSKTFQQAALKSERYRIIGLMCLLGALSVYATVRVAAVGDWWLLAAQSLLFLLSFAGEGTMLAIVQRRLKQGTAVPERVWFLNVLFETQLPTIALFVVLESRIMTPYQAVVAPVMLIYFFFIIFSTLRLRPSLSIWSGVMSAIGYLTIIVFARTRFGGTSTSAAMPPGTYFVYAGFILAAGGVAAFVAGQIRNYVLAALREGELQAKLDRVSHDLEVARSIQQGLFPAAQPRLDGFELAGWNQPADQTGGDYYDWQTLPDGRLAISLGDATGHGIGPALVSTSCRAYARASFLSGSRHEVVLDRLNKLLAADLPSNRFITFAVVLLEPATAQVEVLSAGHGPILWFHHATGRIDSLDAQGIPLGMIAGINYESGTQLSLDPGDLLVMVTDGFYEWEDPAGEQFGLTRLESVIRDSRDGSPAEVIARLREAVVEFCQGTEQMDDLTAVILKRSNVNSASESPEAKEYVQDGK